MPANTDANPTFEEEAFGILTDDDLYLDCILVRPVGVSDEQLKGLRVWVPKFPLNKTSLIACARQEVKSFGERTHIAHLVFDLRGTGLSDGSYADQNFAPDLEAVRLWAEERFGDVDLAFYGFPKTASRGQAIFLPLRPGVNMEYYFYRARGLSGQAVIYLSMYGSFWQQDEAICLALSEAGYNVYALDPLRYLLHASSEGPLDANRIWNDVHTLCEIISDRPYLVAQPIAAGLGLLMAGGYDGIAGVVAIGKAQAGLKPPHIFSRHEAAFDLATQVARLAPRPAVFVALAAQRGMLSGLLSETISLYDHCGEPRKLIRQETVDAPLLLDLLAWLKEKQPVAWRR